MDEWNSIAAIIVAPIATLLAVWLTSRFAWRRTHSEKIWDRKAEAYSAILQALHEMDSSLDSWMSDEMLRREASEEVSQERRERYRLARSKLQSVTGREVWLLNPAVKLDVVELNNVFEAHYDSWFESLDASQSAVGNAIKSIANLAKEELQTGETH